MAFHENKAARLLACVCSREEPTAEQKSGLLDFLKEKYESDIELTWK